jgi:hypothetical protein
MYTENKTLKLEIFNRFVYNQQLCLKLNNSSQRIYNLGFQSNNLTLMIKEIVLNQAFLVEFLRKHGKNSTTLFEDQQICCVTPFQFGNAISPWVGKIQIDIFMNSTSDANKKTRIRFFSNFLF